jgi:hypothetical protein
MHPTLAIVCGAIVLYLGASAVQWRRLKKEEGTENRLRPDRSPVHPNGDKTQT